MAHRRSFSGGITLLFLIVAVPGLALTGNAWSEQASTSAGTTSGITQALPSADGKSTFTTLGTSSGPVANPRRAQPANLLRYEQQVVLVDAGEGVTDQLGKVGLQTDTVQAVFISHLHFDHTGGLFGFLGRRYQARAENDLTIYGPPGTKKTVDALIAAMQPMAEAHTGLVSSWMAGKPGNDIKVIELHEGSKVTLGSIKVTAAVNTHYVLSDKEGKGEHSLAYRFDLPDRSIVYTGDTGPSENVEKLAHGADLLISEIMDMDDELANVKKARPDLSSISLLAIKRHFTSQHLSPNEVGLLAQRASVKTLLLTHIAINPESIEKDRKMIAQHFSGPITFATDLQTY